MGAREKGGGGGGGGGGGEERSSATYLRDQLPISFKVVWLGIMEY